MEQIQQGVIDTPVNKKLLEGGESVPLESAPPPSQVADEDSNRLRRENDRLRAAIKALAVEKNELEEQMYGAFCKLLNTKKQKITELQKELAELKSEQNGNKRPKLAENKPKQKPGSSSFQEETKLELDDDKREVDSVTFKN